MGNCHEGWVIIDKSRDIVIEKSWDIVIDEGWDIVNNKGWGIVIDKGWDIVIDKGWDKGYSYNRWESTRFLQETPDLPSIYKISRLRSHSFITENLHSSNDYSMFDSDLRVGADWWW